MTTATLLSDGEYLSLPEFDGRQELYDGELIELPGAKHSHNKLARHFERRLLTVLGDDRVFREETYHLRPRRWLTPDVSVAWPGQRMDRDYYQGAPMLAVEIASCGNTAEELQRKVEFYIEDGAAEVWVVYPKRRTMMVFRREGTWHIAPDADYVCELVGITVTPVDRAVGA